MFILLLESLLSLDTMSHDENNNKYKMVQNPSVLCLFNTTEFFITSAAVFMCSHVLEGTEMFVFVFYAFDTVCYNHKASKFNSTVILMGFKSQQALFGGVKNPPEMHLTSDTTVISCRHQQEVWWFFFLPFDSFHVCVGLLACWIFLLNWWHSLGFSFWRLPSLKYLDCQPRNNRLITPLLIKKQTLSALPASRTQICLT